MMIPAGRLDERTSSRGCIDCTLHLLLIVFLLYSICHSSCYASLLLRRMSTAGIPAGTAVAAPRRISTAICPSMASQQGSLHPLSLPCNHSADVLLWPTNPSRHIQPSSRRASSKRSQLARLPNADNEPCIHAGLVTVRVQCVNLPPISAAQNVFRGAHVNATGVVWRRI